MDVLYQRGRATSAEVRAELAGDPSDSTVRTQLRVLESKGHVRHEEEGLRFVYLPAVPRSAARRSALKHVVETFFIVGRRLVGALLGGKGTRLTPDELDRIARLVDKARTGGDT
jgi:predicted transcriptional regulator